MDGSARSPRVVYRIAIVKRVVVVTFRRTHPARRADGRLGRNNLTLFGQNRRDAMLGKSSHGGSLSPARRTREDRIARWLVRTCCYLKEVMIAAGAIGFNYSVTMGIIFVNKLLFLRTKFPVLTLAASHLAVSALFTRAAMYAGVFKPRDAKMDRMIFAVAALQTLAISLGQASLKLNSMGFFQLTKRCRCLWSRASSSSTSAGGSPLRRLGCW